MVPGLITPGQRMSGELFPTFGKLSEEEPEGHPTPAD
jgi:hypothetical protein